MAYAADVSGELASIFGAGASREISVHITQRVFLEPVEGENLPYDSDIPLRTILANSEPISTLKMETSRNMLQLLLNYPVEGGIKLLRIAATYRGATNLHGVISED